MRVFNRLEKQVSQRKQAHSRGRRGLHTQVQMLTRTLYGYLLEVNVYLTTSHADPELARLQLAESGEQLKKEVEEWLAAD